MPRATRSSTRTSKVEEASTSKKTPKRQSSTNKNDEAHSSASHTSSTRQSRKNPASPSTPKSSKRRKNDPIENTSEDDSIDSPIDTFSKKSPLKVAKASGDKTSPKTPRSSARRNIIVEDQTQTSTRSRSLKDKPGIIQKPESNSMEINISPVTRRSKRPNIEPSSSEIPSPKRKASSSKTTPKSTRHKRPRKSDELSAEPAQSEGDISNKTDEFESKRQKFSSIVFKPPLPKRLSRVELYNEALKNLASRLNMFDLTDPSEATNVWCDWPSDDGPLSIKDIQNILLSRSWYSENPQASSDLLVNGNGTCIKEESSLISIKEIDVISYCLAHLNQCSLQHNFQKAFLEKELSTYKADIYCFQNVDSHCQNFLQNILKSQECDFSTLTGSNLIAFQSNQFCLMSQHKVSAMDFAKQVVKECAYPMNWCKSIKEVLENSDFDEMLVTVLKHKASNQIILVASHSLLLFPNKSRTHNPDITALNITGALWNLARIWQDQTLRDTSTSTRNGQSNGPFSSIQNGHLEASSLNNGHSETLKSSLSPRWLLCGPFNASEKSPIYQLARDGYPDDQTLDRLRCLKNVKLPTHISLHTPPINPMEGQVYDSLDDSKCHDGSFKTKALIDLLWNAFQHPCTDVTSCYQAVVGREPPFTRLCAANPRPGQACSTAMDYIWCSGSTLKPQTVLMPPCRALSAVLNGKQSQNNQTQLSAIPLMARMRLVPTAS